MVVFGTRPEAIKLAPVVLSLKKEKSLQTIVCSTGQHREMLKQVLNIFNLDVDEDLQLMKPNQSLFDITSQSIIKMEETLNKHQPDLVIVQGDTTTAFTCALSAFYKKIKVAHVEAGLRSYDVFHPYPEEANRRFVSVISDFNFVPTRDSRDNLLNEGINQKSIYLTGNTVVDALLMMKNKFRQKEYSKKLENSLKEKLSNNIFDKKFILITLHRREKFGEEMNQLLKAILELAKKYSHYNFIYPVHMNPNVSIPVKEILGGCSNIILTQPMNYQDFLFMMSRCHFLMSDSGGVQEECYVFKKPIIVLRTVTERNEAVKAGYAFLTGSNKKLITWRFKWIDSKLKNGRNLFPRENPFGDGISSSKIVRILKRSLT